MQPDAYAPIDAALQAITAIETFTSGRSGDDYLHDPLLRSGVERQLLIIGEAMNQLRRVDPETAEHITGLGPAIGLRNVLAHSYATVDDDVIWRTVTNDLPSLRADLVRAKTPGV